MTKNNSHLYRAVDTWYSVSDPWTGEHSYSSLQVKIQEYPILRRTPKGAWVEEGFGERFVLLTARKRFACPTKEEALESLIARRERQQKIYLSRAYRARQVIEEANKQLGRGEILRFG